MLEEGSFRGRTADFVFMFLFGGLLMTVSFMWLFQNQIMRSSVDNDQWFTFSVCCPFTSNVAIISSVTHCSSWFIHWELPRVVFGDTLQFAYVLIVSKKGG